MIIIDGKKIAQEIRAELKTEIDKLISAGKNVPGLVAILVGDNPASESYVRGKAKACEEIGMRAVTERHPSDITEKTLLDLIDSYNNNDKFNGILVQLPLPKHIDEDKVIETISPKKDVDGFHPINVGNLVIGKPAFRSCTPAGIQELIVRSGIETSGAEAVVVGRSNIVGKPIANMLFQKGRGADATVTVVHTRTKNMAEHCKRADILVVAAGVPGLVKPEWIKPGACVIDVGVNRIGEKPSKDDPKKMVPILKGDVDFEAAKEIAGSITPVPGGVGPMTITMLMKNTLKSLKFKLGIQ